ncbi:hypothetical protein D9M69_716490 [compost metagenome]
MATSRAELVVGKLLLACQEAKRLGLDDDGPASGLGADGAVASAGAGGEVDVGFEADRAAVATARVGLEHEDSLVKNGTPSGAGAILPGGC